MNRYCLHHRCVGLFWLKPEARDWQASAALCLSSPAENGLERSSSDYGTKGDSHFTMQFNA